jgi:hypothetical protein
LTDTGLSYLYGLSLESVGVSFIPNISYDGVKAIGKPSLLYFHDLGCPLITPQTIESLKSWSPKIQFIASSKQYTQSQDPKYADYETVVDETSISLWMRADDLKASGHSPGVEKPLYWKITL